MADKIISGIYKIENVVNGKCYVGSACNLQARRRQHFNNLKKRSHCNIKLQRAWNRYGESALIFLVIEYVKIKEELIKREQFWIDNMRSAKFGYNIAPTAGSSLGIRRSLATRKKVSAAQLGKKREPLSEETKAKIAIAHKGKPKPKLTEARKLAISICSSGRKHTEETKKKMSISQTGRVFSEETRIQMSISRKGKKPTDAARAAQSLAMIGRKVSVETREKIGAAQRGVKRQPCSEELKEQNSLRMIGKRWTPEQIAKRIATRARNTAIKAAQLQQAFQR